MEECRTLPSLYSLVQATLSHIPPASSPQNWRQWEEPTQDNFERLFEQFIHQFHQGTCRISDHLNKFNDPPTYQKKTFTAFELFVIVRASGGISKLQKLPRQWTISQPLSLSNAMPRNWTQVASQLGYDTKQTNISFRIKEWLKFHHIDAFFDYLMHIPNEFYTGGQEMIPQSQELYPPPYHHLALGSGMIRYSDIGEESVDNRKRSGEVAVAELRKRSMSSTPLSSPMRTLQVVEDDSLDNLEKPQLIQIISGLRNEVKELYLKLRRCEDYLTTQDKRTHKLEQEIKDKNMQLNRSVQFKELMQRYMEYLPDNLKL